MSSDPMIARRRPAPAVVALVLVLMAGLGWPMAAKAAPRQDEGTAADSATTDEEATDDEAILNLVGCMQSAERLSVVFMIDESGSLRDSDPDGRRVDAAIAAIDGLGLLVGDDRDLDIDVLLAAFGSEFREIRGWTAIAPENDGVLRESLQTFADLTDGRDTDFVNGLGGAREALAARTAELAEQGEPETCKAVLVFTDGTYALAVRTPENMEQLGATKDYAPEIELDSEEAVEQVLAAGTQTMCREGGLADQIRGDDISLLSIALSGEPTGADQVLLAAATRGRAGDLVCGRPTSSAPGAFVVATSPDVLITRFDEITTRVAGGTLVPPAGDTVACGPDPCPEGTRTVMVDPTMNRLRILAFAPEPGMVVQVEGPGGTAEIDNPGNASAGEVELTARGVVDRGFAITAERPAETGDWEGEWTVQLLSPDGSLEGQSVVLAIYVFSDIGVRLVDDIQLTRGAEAEVSAELVLPEGVEATELIDEADAVLRLADPLTDEVLQADLSGPVGGPYTGTVTVPVDYRTSFYRASMELHAVSRQGAEIVSRSAPTDVMVRRPEGSVQFSPHTIEFDRIVGQGSSSADLVLLGGTDAGCVWFGPAEGTVPDGAGELTITYDGRAADSEASCIPVPAESNVIVAVEASPQNRATGVALGALVVHEKTDATEATVTAVPYSLDLEAGIDTARRLLLFVILMVVGLGLPAALVLMINAVSAQFQSLDAVRAASVPVKVQGSDIYRTEGGRIRPFELHEEDFTSLSGAGSSRRFVFGGVEFTARASRNPLGPMVAMAAPEGGAERLKGGAGRKVELDAGLAGSWVLLIDPDRTTRARSGVAEGNLIMFVTTGTFEPQARRLEDDLRRRLPSTASSLAKLVRGKAHA